MLPVLEEDDSLSWRRAPDDEVLVPGRRGTVQPDETALAADIRSADVIVVPGLAFDVHGGRLGRGGGSYDRALARARPDAVVVGLAPEEAVLPRVPMDAHDRRVAVLVTPARVVRCGE